MKFYKLAAKLPNYVKRFGFIDGARLLYQIEGLKQLPQKAESVRQFSVPGLNNPVYLRDCVGDHATFWQCLVRNQYDFSQFPQAERLYRKYEKLVSSGQHPLIIDGGGNIGLSALWFATKFPKAKIIVIEPNQANLKILNLNLAHLQERVLILNGGIWNEAGYLQIINPDAGPTAYRLQLTQLPDAPGATRCYTINELCAMTNIDDPLIVKLDIEGSQKELFTSNSDWVNRADLITLELDDWLLPWQGTSRSFFACLSQYPFEYLLGGESIFCFNDHISRQETAGSTKQVEITTAL